MIWIRLRVNVSYEIPLAFRQKIDTYLYWTGFTLRSDAQILCCHRIKLKCHIPSTLLQIIKTAPILHRPIIRVLQCANKLCQLLNLWLQIYI